jgi:hypothetical protein
MQRTRQGKEIATAGGQNGPCERQKTMWPLLHRMVVLFSMRQRRAPLPVSPLLWKGLLRQGFLNDPDELGNIARRISFLGDERLVLAELRIRTATTPRQVRDHGRKEPAHDRRHLEDLDKCQ